MTFLCLTHLEWVATGARPEHAASLGPGTEHYKAQEHPDSLSLVQFDGEQACSLRLVGRLLILKLCRPSRKLTAGVEVTFWLKAESAELNSVIVVRVQIYRFCGRLHRHVYIGGVAVDVLNNARDKVMRTAWHKISTDKARRAGHVSRDAGTLRLLF